MQHRLTKKWEAALQILVYLRSLTIHENQKRLIFSENHCMAKRIVVRILARLWSVNDIRVSK
jgi:DNA-binding IscR family transcriptional regulator